MCCWKVELQIFFYIDFSLLFVFQICNCQCHLTINYNEVISAVRDLKTKSAGKICKCQCYITINYNVPVFREPCSCGSVVRALR